MRNAVMCCADEADAWQHNAAADEPMQAETEKQMSGSKLHSDRVQLQRNRYQQPAVNTSLGKQILRLPCRCAIHLHNTAGTTGTTTSDYPTALP
jgi:hypothetical protein